MFGKSIMNDEVSLEFFLNEFDELEKSRYSIYTNDDSSKVSQETKLKIAQAYLNVFAPIKKELDTAMQESAKQFSFPSPEIYKNKNASEVEWQIKSKNNKIVEAFEKTCYSILKKYEIEEGKDLNLRTYDKNLKNSYLGSAYIDYCGNTSNGYGRLFSNIINGFLNLMDAYKVIINGEDNGYSNKFIENEKLIEQYKAKGTKFKEVEVQVKENELKKQLWQIPEEAIKKFPPLYRKAYEVVSAPNPVYGIKLPYGEKYEVFTQGSCNILELEITTPKGTQKFKF